jgi:hypothetical protein
MQQGQGIHPGLTINSSLLRSSSPLQQSSDKIPIKYRNDFQIGMIAKEEKGSRK